MQPSLVGRGSWILAPFLKRWRGSDSCSNCIAGNHSSWNILTRLKICRPNDSVHNLCTCTYAGTCPSLQMNVITLILLLITCLNVSACNGNDISSSVVVVAAGGVRGLALLQTVLWPRAREWKWRNKGWIYVRWCHIEPVVMLGTWSTEWVHIHLHPYSLLNNHRNVYWRESILSKISTHGIGCTHYEEWCNVELELSCIWLSMDTYQIVPSHCLTVCQQIASHSTHAEVCSSTCTYMVATQSSYEL